MIIKTAEFVQSVADWRQCPQNKMTEIAFIGRSNVGKSSLINMIVNQKKLAKTSSQPGKTQTINHFLINKSFYFVDLPGYGYAKISKTMREKWVKMVFDYIHLRQNLALLCILVDSRIEPQNIDIEFINKMGEMMVPIAIVFTKAEKLSNYKAEQNVKNFKAKLLENWEEAPLSFLTSAESKLGKDTLLEYFDTLV